MKTNVSKQITHIFPDVINVALQIALWIPDQDVGPALLAVGLEVVGRPLLAGGVEVVFAGGGGSDAVRLGAISHRRSVI